MRQHACPAPTTLPCRLASLALLALALTACPQRHSRDYPAPMASSLLEIVTARQAAVRAVNLETRTTSWLGGERARATVLMLVERGGRLRFEAEMSLKGTIAALATDGRRFALIEMDGNTVKRGPACPANIAQLVRIPMSPRDIAAILLGDAPIGEDTRAEGVIFDEERGAEVLEVTSRGEDGPRRLWISLRKQAAGTGAPGDFAIVGVEGQAAAGKRWRVRYEDLSLVGGVYMPGVIRYAEPGRSFDDGVEIKIRDRRVGVTPDEAAFALPTPPGFTELEVGCDRELPPLPPSP